LAGKAGLGTAEQAGKVWPATAAAQPAVAERVIVEVEANSAVGEVAAVPFKASIAVAVQRAARASAAAPAGEALEAVGLPGVEVVVQEVAGAAAVADR
jgi:hypothetical protein